MENYSIWIELIVAICGALTVCVPLVIKLANTIAAFISIIQYFIFYVNHGDEIFSQI